MIGRWKSESVCLELFANGDFEVSDIATRPKVLVMGKAKLEPDRKTGAITLHLATARIWRGRYVSNCRKHHQTGDFIVTREVLGAMFAPNTTTKLVLRRTSDTEIEVCGVQCAKLTRTTPLLGARWRRAKLAYPGSPETAWTAGELLEIKLDDMLGHVWAGLANKKFVAVYAKTEVKYESPDRFTLTVTPERYDADQKQPPRALGLAMSIGTSHELHVTRLAGQLIEVCAAPGRCATLERQFDGNSYDLD
ncbi:MAG: hypothetical protein WKG01_37020 [Kofleriaceae bacterium]